MVDMVDINEGDEICDPACGVGKFLLEAALKVDEPFIYENGHVTKKVKLYGYEKEMDEKGSTSGYDLTTILAKANTMIYFSSLFKENNTLADIKTISQELLNETYFSSKTILGTLEKTDGKQYEIFLRTLIQCPIHGRVENGLKRRLSVDLNVLPKAFFFYVFG